MKKIKSIILGAVSFLTLMVVSVSAFTNPVVGEALGADAESATSGATFVSYFVTIWQAFITIGAILVLIYFLWGAIEWVTAGADKSILDRARNRITQAMIGLLILISAFVIIEFVSQLFFGDEFSILNFQFVAPLEQGVDSSLLHKYNLFAPQIAHAVDINIGSTAQGQALPGTADYTAGDGEAGFGLFMTRVLNIVLVVGSIIVLFYLVWGGLEWVSSGGDKSKVEAARTKITQSMIGLIVMAAAIALFVMLQGFLGVELFTFN
ncbi:hypothetical protein KA111_02325 [Candidatus Woesebacteria bacterium]|nr:hypothetical protein [Candidatus Woesebacteria bacterium]